MVRPKKKRTIAARPPVAYFKPVGIALSSLKEEVLALEEVEAFRLVDGENLSQEEAAKRMDISQSTLTRVLAAARKKIAQAITQGKAMRIKGGDYRMFGRGRGLGRGLGRGAGRGRMGGQFAAGPGGVCVCTNPDCQHEVTHQAGQACYQLKCPKCGSPMIRKG